MSFSYSGAEQQYLIPLGAIGIRIQAWGGHGGAATNPSSGGFVDVTLDATQLIGPNLTVFVGQDGQQPAGGDGNIVGNGGNGNSGGWGGGAATYVKDSNGSYLVIGAGGGGDAVPLGIATTPKGGAGGGNAGDGIAGQNGQLNIATGGGGGTQFAGGAGGSPAGQAGGSLGTGINVGGNGAAVDNPGGGGGGFYGGGGGGGFSFGGTNIGGAGGGGSNFYDAGKTLVLDANTSNLRLDPDGFVFIQAIFAPCVAEGTLVSLQNGLQKPIEELRKGDRLSGGITLESLIKFKTPARCFIQIPDNHCSAHLPLLIRRGHPILVAGREVLPEALIGQMTIEEIFTDKPMHIYTLVTQDKKFIKMQNHTLVSTWSKKGWENHLQSGNVAAFDEF